MRNVMRTFANLKGSRSPTGNVKVRLTWTLTLISIALCFLNFIAMYVVTPAAGLWAAILGFLLFCTSLISLALSLVNPRQLAACATSSVAFLIYLALWAPIIRMLAEALP